MMVKEAIWATLEIASERRHLANLMAEHDTLGWRHLSEMWRTIDEEGASWSDTKLCRWLGWMQAAIVSWNIVTLEEMKELNRRFA